MERRKVTNWGQWWQSGTCSSWCNKILRRVCGEVLEEERVRKKKELGFYAVVWWVAFKQNEESEVERKWVGDENTSYTHTHTLLMGWEKASYIYM